MGQCNYIDMEAVHEFLKRNPHATTEQAMSECRCKNESMKNQLRCNVHGGGDILQFYSRDMQDDERDRFNEMFKNMINVYNIDEGNLFVTNIVAMTCREVIQSHNSENNMSEHIKNAIYFGRELAATPREQKSMKVEVRGDMLKDVEEVKAIAKERIRQLQDDD